MTLFRVVGIVAASLALLSASSAQALTLQPVGTFNHPTYVTSDPGNPDRLFVVEQEGTIELIEAGVTSQFADLSAQVGCAGKCEGERGLMSIALAPDFDSSGRLYVDYANNATGVIHVDELTVRTTSGKRAEASTLRPLLSIPHADAKNHNGGQLQLGPDGDLYISTGDGGGENDQFHNAQDLGKPLGKILRIRPNPSGPAPFYIVPGDNPFVGVPGDLPEIWSYGLRNPFRFSFDRLTGDMAIGDVGQVEREEIDFARSPLPGVVGGAGANYGWNCREGFIAGPTATPDPDCATTPLTDFTKPAFDYEHTPDPDIGGANRCAIIGGYVVRDRSLGESLYGRYLYGDLCGGELRSIDLSAADPASTDRAEKIQFNNLNSFGEDSCGRIYVVEEGGRVSRLTGPTPAVCPRPEQPAPAPPSSSATAKAAAPTVIGITAQRRRVERGKRALLTVWVAPCSGRKGQAVELLRNGHPFGTRFLSRACTARFLPRIRGGTTFAAATREARGYQSGKSRQLTIRLAQPKRQH